MAADLDNQTKAQSGEATENKESSPNKTALSETPEERKAKAMNALVAGKRHMLVQDIAAAVTSLGEACELLSAEFGETAPECAEAYFNYGKALLEMARLEAGVLGNGLDADVESSEESEDHEDEDGPETEGAATPEDKEAGEEKESEEEKGETDSVGGEKKEGEDAAAQEAEDEDDPSNLQLAWEMLELAKMVFKEQLEGSKKDSVSQQLKAILEKRLCETFLTLGEVSLENENYEQAVEDLNLCLERQKATLPSDSRAIAETHYQLGVALGFHMKYEEAVLSLEAAISVLETRIKNLENESESPDESKKADAFYTREKEVNEIKALIPEIKEKITDTNEMKEESIKKVAEMKEQIGFGSSGSSNGAGSSAAKPISTISIKRKKDESSDTTSESKKVKTSEENSSTS